MQKNWQCGCSSSAASFWRHPPATGKACSRYVLTTASATGSAHLLRVTPRHAIIDLKRSDAAAGLGPPCRSGLEESGCIPALPPRGDQMNIRLKPLSEEGGHRSGGIRRRHAADQQSRSTQLRSRTRVAIRSGPNFRQMTRRKMGQQLTAPAPRSAVPRRRDASEG